MKPLLLFCLLILIGCSKINSNHWMKKVGKSYRKKDPFCNCPKDEQTSRPIQTLTNSLGSFKIDIDSSFIIDSSENYFFQSRWLRIKNKKDSTSSLIIYMDSLYNKQDSLFFPNNITKIEKNDTILWSGLTSNAPFPLTNRLPNQRENFGDNICFLTFKIISNNRNYYFVIQTSNPTKDTYPKNFHCNFQKVIESFTTF